ncbi:phosphotransferase family protein [Nocardioides terrisoli]|uniref:phosphotransferase family protein n=1 Tax=Nocardioides terrisoli TaxID=3388267 RepID=UPI00287B9F0D|nr:phosphotransferase family protein [Nocardioides marmorisolisilvae]
MISQLEEQLRVWVEGTRGSGARVSGVRTLDGHSGFTYGFDVTQPDGTREPLVLRLPPPGAGTRNADVLRQIPVLRYLASKGLPVAPVLDPGTDDQWFGSPFLLVRRMPGHTVSLEIADRQPPGAHHVRAAVTTLGQLHRLPASVDLRQWSEPVSYTDEVCAWDRALERMPTEWQKDATRLRRGLLDGAPAEPSTGLVHGDYQFSNLLFDDDRLGTVLDWEVSGLGPQLLDIGWFLSINDQASWSHDVATQDIPPQEVVLAWYESALGRAVDREEVAFARALASYRFAVIAGLNLNMHRSGRREDPHWERIAPSIPRLVSDGLRRLDVTTPNGRPR